MRVLSLIVSLLFVVVAHAAPKAVTTNTTSASLAPTAHPVWKHISASVYTSMASTLTIGSSKLITQGGSLNGNGEFGTDSAFGINGRYSDMIQDRLSYFGGLSVDARREVSSINIGIGGGRLTGTFLEKPAFRPFIAEGGLRYDLNNFLYATVGLNYTIYNMISEGAFNGLSMDPAIGYQASIGGSPIDRLALELTLRDVRYSSFSGKLKGNADTRFEGSDVALSGLNLGARYAF